MNVNISELLEILLAAAWRRRMLILVPFGVFLGISAIAAVLWPRMYTSQILIMLQEREASNPLSSTVEITREGRLKADEVEALLKSERVLSSAILDINIGKRALTAKELEIALRDLKRAIKVRVVGSEFIQIELNETNPHGLGERLATVMTRFLERLLSRENTIKTARQFAMEQRKRDVENAKSALNEWMVRHSAFDVASGNAPLDEFAAIVTKLQLKFAVSRQSLVDAAGAVLDDRLDPAQIEKAVAAERRRVLAGRQTGADTARSSPQRAAAFNDLEKQLEAYRAVSSELSQAQLVAHKLREANAASSAIYLERQRLEAKLAETVAQYDVLEKPASKSVGHGSTPLGLIAPEHIRIIDDPRDPVSPTTSILKIIVACIGAGIGLGIGLASLAEQLDDRIYSSAGLERLAGVSLIVRLPKLNAESMEDMAGAGGPVSSAVGGLVGASVPISLVSLKRR